MNAVAVLSPSPRGIAQRRAKGSVCGALGDWEGSRETRVPGALKGNIGWPLIGSGWGLIRPNRK